MPDIIHPVGGHSCPISCPILSCLKALLPKLGPRVVVPEGTPTI